MVVRRLSQGFSHFEAYCNEMATIKALDLNHLTNKINGTCYGDMKNWSDIEIENYGNMLLYTSLLLMVNGNPTYMRSENLS